MVFPRILETGRRHWLKCWPGPFENILQGWKTFEFRKDDREGGYQQGDILDIAEWDPAYFDGKGGETERALIKAVSYVLRGPDFGVPVGYCVMALAEVEGEERCNCTNCPTMVPRSWASGMCPPCAGADCDCAGADCDCEDLPPAEVKP